ncbi:hypothetical protein GF354_01310 [Candidatus Peregrinibacteria bacterium]|nr:hypothetical protein [Candidatus Peregrinibacteria bacterium]
MTNPNIPEQRPKKIEKVKTRKEQIADVNQKYIKHAIKELKRLSAYIRDEEGAKDINIKIAALVWDLKDISKDLKVGKIDKLIKSSAILDGKLKDVITSINPILKKAGKKPIKVPQSTLLASAGTEAEKLMKKRKTVAKPVVKKKEKPKRVEPNISKDIEKLDKEDKNIDEDMISQADVILGEENPGQIPQSTNIEEVAPAQMLAEEPWKEAKEEAPEEPQEAAVEEVEFTGKSGGVDIGVASKAKEIKEAVKKEEESKLPPRNADRSASDWESAFAFGQAGAKNVLKAGGESLTDTKREKPEINIKALSKKAASAEKMLKKLSKIEPEELKPEEESFTSLSAKMDKLFTDISNGEVGPDDLGDFLKSIESIKEDKLKSKFIVDKLQDSNIELAAYQGEKTKFTDIPTNKSYKVKTDEALELIYQSRKGDDLREKLARAASRTKTQEKYVESANEVLESLS